MRSPDRLDWTIISITGHRELGPISKKKVWASMRILVEKPHVDAIYFGGALGTDTEALKASLHYRTGKRPHLVVVVPNTTSHQPAAARDWIYQADEVIELGNPITQDDGWASFKKRNEFLVDCGTYLVAFFNGNYRSGTGHAIRYAEKDGLAVYKILVGRD